MNNVQRLIFPRPSVLSTGSNKKKEFLVSNLINQTRFGPISEMTKELEILFRVLIPS